MGNFYTNFTVMGCEAEAVVSLAQELRREAFIIDAGRGDVILYDAICDDQDTEEIVRLGEKLSSKLALPILAALNHDDDHLLLWIFYGGKQVAFYDSILDAAPFACALQVVRQFFSASRIDAHPGLADLHLPGLPAPLHCQTAGNPRFAHDSGAHLPNARRPSRRLYGRRCSQGLRQASSQVLPCSFQGRTAICSPAPGTGRAQPFGNCRFGRPPNQDCQPGSVFAFLILVENQSCRALPTRR